MIRILEKDFSVEYVHCLLAPSHFISLPPVCESIHAWFHYAQRLWKVIPWTRFMQHVLSLVRFGRQRQSCLLHAFAVFAPVHICQEMSKPGPPIGNHKAARIGDHCHWTLMHTGHLTGILHKNNLIGIDFMHWLGSLFDHSFSMKLTNIYLTATLIDYTCLIRIKSSPADANCRRRVQIM
jgi:hypothetical protein